MIVTIHLPMPPSVNNLYINAGNRRVRSRRYRSWQEDAGWHLKAAKPDRIVGPVTVVVELFVPDKRRRDADNMNKPVLDLLVAHGVIEADDRRIVRSVISMWIDEPRVHSCTVIITPVVASPPLSRMEA